MPHPLSGVYAASLTPLDSRFAPDLDSLPVYLRFLADEGCHGALLLGTTGEGPSFSPSERESIFRAAARVQEEIPAFRLLAGTGTPSLEESIEITRAAFDAGFDGVVTLPPYYFRRVSEEGLFQWFDMLIRRAVPEGKYLLGYHIPGVSGVPLSPDLLARLKDAHPEKFAGIKDSSHDAAHARALGDRFGDSLLVLNGTDSFLSLALDAGAQGCITAPANLLARDLRRIWDAHLSGGDASEAQTRVRRAREILEGYAPFPPILKALAARFYDFPRWAVRPPLLPVSGDAEAEAAEALQAWMPAGG
jgi:4-hydroxy-tetrahydrodipicolinate synthase